MIRSVYRFEDLSIEHVPEGGVIWETFCAAYQCGQGSGAQDDQDAAQGWALRHSGAAGHNLFRRVVTDHADVMYAEAPAAEKERDSVLRR
ncbi:hypothetical protein ACFCYI_24760 [Streptomyces sp. NPDC056257]|uniref:DUF7848 domain-containing protein n=1 Tax=Streptomyces sp. NPDC056257 TaxID=3345765 RepID=UPI0035DC3A4B